MDKPHFNVLPEHQKLLWDQLAEEQPMPLMLTDISWEQVRKSIIAEVKKIRII